MSRHQQRIELRTNAHEAITSATAENLPKETGGILLGYHEDDNIVVTHALLVSGRGATANGYVRDDNLANDLLSDFLAQRSADDPTGYVGEWHSHPAPSGLSTIDVAAIRDTAKASGGPLALVVHIVGGQESFRGLIAQRRRLGRVTSAEVEVLLPAPRFTQLGPLPAGAVRGDGPVFISYRQSDGTGQAESLQDLLRAAGLVVWRDRTDLRPGTTVDRLEHALTHGLSAAVLVVTPEIAKSDIVRERELPRLLQLDADDTFSLSVANKVARSDDELKCDYDAPDRLLRLTPARTLADKKQSNMLVPAGETEIIRDLLMHRIEQRRPEIHEQNRPFTIRLQTRPSPFALDADNEDLHIRIRASESGRLPSRAGLDFLWRTLPLTSDAVYAAGAKQVLISGGAHLSVALAIGAALPETKFGRVDVLDIHDELWASAPCDDDPETTSIQIDIDDNSTRTGGGTSARVAVLVTLAGQPDYGAFERLITSSTEGFDASAIISVGEIDRIDSRESARVSRAIARQIKQLAASHGRAEVHLAFHGPYTMAVQVGRLLNTLRAVVYEWDGDTVGHPNYVPALVLAPGVTNGPITEVIL